MYLCIQCMMIKHDFNRIAPFGNLRINAYLRLPVAYRSLSRPSSALSAKAFPLCSFSLDLAECSSDTTFLFAFVLNL